MQINIEVTPVLRGRVVEQVLASVKPLVEDDFGFAAARIASFEDLYAGKIVAVLDRSIRAPSLTSTFHVAWSRRRCLGGLENKREFLRQDATSTR